MDRELAMASQNWMNQFNADIKSKVENLLDENDSTPEELAEAIGVDVDEIYDILEGEGENISIETLIKAFMVLGFAIEIKPIEETPLGSYDNVNPHVMDRREARPNPFMHPCPPRGMHGMPHHFDPNDIPPHVREEMDREFERRHQMGDVPPFNPRHEEAPRFRHAEKPKSPFAVMGREELSRIIRNKLWDSEIDLNNAPTEALVRFLEEKDKRMKSLKKNEELERDPQVAQFVKNMKKNIKENPQFRAYMKNFLNNLDEE